MFMLFRSSTDQQQKIEVSPGCGIVFVLGGLALFSLFLLALGVLLILGASIGVLLVAIGGLLLALVLCLFLLFLAISLLLGIVRALRNRLRASQHYQQIRPLLHTLAGSVWRLLLQAFLWCLRQWAPTSPSASSPPPTSDEPSPPGDQSSAPSSSGSSRQFLLV